MSSERLRVYPHRSLRRSNIWLLAMAFACIFTVAVPFTVSADTISVLNFDSVSVAPGGVVDGTAYLSSFGVTYSSPNPTAGPGTYNGVGTAITAVSGTNFFGMNATSITNPESFSETLTFATPLNSVSWDTAILSTAITFPSWTATAYDGSTPVGTVSQTGGFGTGTSAAFTITGPDITSLTFTDTYSGQSTAGPTIDNLTLDAPTSAPEIDPTSALAPLALLGGAVMIIRGRRKQLPQAGPHPVC